MVSVVETMMTADCLRPTAYGPEEDEIGIIKDTHKARPAPAFDSLLSVATMCAKRNASPDSIRRKN
jgi:hypothetical protein